MSITGVVAFAVPDKQGTQRYYKLSDITDYLITNRYNARGVVGCDTLGGISQGYRTINIARTVSHSSSHRMACLAAMQAVVLPSLAA